VQPEQRIPLLCFGAVALSVGLLFGTARASVAHRGSSAVRLAQDESSDDESDVAPAEVEKYIEVQKAMQHNHSLTVEQACAQQGLALGDFRQLEDRIERDDALRERVRKALRDAAANQSK